MNVGTEQQRLMSLIPSDLLPIINLMREHQKYTSAGILQRFPLCEKVSASPDINGNHTMHYAAAVR